MVNANWRPTRPGGGGGGGTEAALDEGCWRAQLPPRSRERIVDKIPIFKGRYLKILSMETERQGTIPNALPFNSAGSSSEDSAVKRARLPSSNQDETQNAVDYISQLPDAIIFHIFSFLTTKDTIKTSVLSKQWRSTWTSNQYMSFSLPPGGSQKSKGFIAFVDSVLSRYTAKKLKRFLFDAPCPASMRFSLGWWPQLAVERDVEEVSASLDRWLQFAVEHDVEEALSLMEARDMFLPSLKCRHLILLGAAGHEGVPEAIAKILESTRLLEKLFLQMTCTPDSEIGLKAERAGCRVFAGEEFWNFVKWRIYHCLMHLRHVEIVDGGASLLAWEPVLSLLKFLLQNALWLDKIVIDSTNSKSSQASEPSPLLEVARILLSHPKCSPSAKVILRYPFQGCPSV
ncbi:F-box/LRR-repeat protein At3g03360 isoform X6 [Eucalyptus grandis]|uniref:F-box/LRR-repeat protein At3g03360 isoform X6 n=1 Tax=Eucalyptus grandis TaxID=71139 RepID=UPI00192E93A8|nr:F-box/LRR-repeat protein At3g03360 isoform X6 [Eucalyptus grandis]